MFATFSPQKEVGQDDWINLYEVESTLLASFIEIGQEEGTTLEELKSLTLELLTENVGEFEYTTDGTLSFAEEYFRLNRKILEDFLRELKRTKDINLIRPLPEAINTCRESSVEFLDYLLEKREFAKRILGKWRD